MNSGGSRHHHLALPALPYPHYGLLGDPSQPLPPHSLFHHHPSSLAAVMSSPSDGRNGSGGGGVEEEDEEDEEEEEEEDNGNNHEEEEFEAEDDGIGEGDIVQEANNHNHNHSHSHSHSHNHNHRSIPNGNVINPNPNSKLNSNPNLKPKPKPKPNSNLNPILIRSFKPKFPTPQYRECLKNHAASIGRHALDGCGEFMYPSDNTLCCSVCGCHRNFHRREADADTDAVANPCFECGTDRQKNQHIYHYHHHGGQTVMSFKSSQIPSPSPSPSPPPNLNSPNHHYSYQHQYQHHHPAVVSLRKRFRTKFTSEQKDRMLHFAEKVDWKIHKSDEAAVDAFSAEVGIKQSILKVWMHNNKNTLGKKQCNNLNNNGSRQWADDDTMVEMEAPSTYSNSYSQQPKRTFSSGIHDGGNDDNGNNNMLVGMQEHDCSSGNTDRVDSSIKGGDCRSPHGDKSWDDCHLFDVHLVGPSASSLPQLESEQHSST